MSKLILENVQVPIQTMTNARCTLKLYFVSTMFKSTYLMFQCVFLFLLISITNKCINFDWLKIPNCA